MAMPNGKRPHPAGLVAVRLVMEPKSLVSPACLAASLASSGHRTS
jgi:hypothetical protein